MADSPSTWKYVGVWLLAAFLGNIASHIISAVSYSGARTHDDFVSAMAIGIPLEAVAIGVVIIAVYSFFPSLDMSAVFPWMVGLISIGVLINLGVMASSGFDHGWIYFYQIACTAAMLYGIRAFFKSNGRIA